jgi:hypothetical protein
MQRLSYANLCYDARSPGVQLETLPGLQTSRVGKIRPGLPDPATEGRRRAGCRLCRRTSLRPVDTVRGAQYSTVQYVMCYCAVHVYVNARRVCACTAS